MGLVGGRLVADEEVEETIVVEVRPGGRLRRVQGEQARLFGDVGEGAVALIAQE